MTNYEKLMQDMTPDHLAHIIIQMETCEFCAYKFSCHEMHRWRDCTEGVKAWLKQPVEATTKQGGDSNGVHA